MTGTDASPPPPPYCACPNQPLHTSGNVGTAPTHARCPSTWICEKRGCQFKPVAQITSDDSLFAQVFGKRW